MKVREYFIKTLNGMALGLFASLIIGLIFKQIGQLSGIGQLVILGRAAQVLMGPAIGAAVAYSIKTSPLGIFAALVAGAIGAGTVVPLEGAQVGIVIGEPMGAYIAAVVAAEVSKWISGRTRVDIVLVPAATILAGGITGLTISPMIAAAMKSVGSFINYAAELQPIPMGMLIAVVMGMLLTLPVSSAALAISLGLSGIAGGASLVGCSCQMIGFAVLSYRDNGFGGAVAQGLGTSMLQIPNIIRKPVVWLPPIAASFVLGPISAAVLHMKSNSIGAGMGTSGLVGQFGAYAEMGHTMSSGTFLLMVGLMHFVFPALLTLAFGWILRKKGWLQDGDLKLEASV